MNRIVYYVMKRMPDSDSPLFDDLVIECRFKWLAEWHARRLNQKELGHYVTRVKVGPKRTEVITR